MRDLLAGKEADYYHACKYSSNWSDDYFYTRYTLGVLDSHARHFAVPMTHPPYPGNPGGCYDFPGIGGTARCSRIVDCGPTYQSIEGKCFRSASSSAPIDPKKNLGSCPAPTGGSPSTPNPISIALGNKFLDEADIQSVGFSLHRFYNSGNTGRYTLPTQVVSDLLARGGATHSKRGLTSP